MWIIVLVVFFCRGIFWSCDSEFSLFWIFKMYLFVLLWNCLVEILEFVFEIRLVIWFLFSFKDLVIVLLIEMIIFLFGVLCIVISFVFGILCNWFWSFFVICFRMRMLGGLLVFYIRVVIMVYVYLWLLLKIGDVVLVGNFFFVLDRVFWIIENGLLVLYIFFFNFIDIKERLVFEVECKVLIFVIFWSLFLIFLVMSFFICFVFVLGNIVRIVVFWFVILGFFFWGIVRRVEILLIKMIKIVSIKRWLLLKKRVFIVFFFGF